MRAPDFWTKTDLKSRIIAAVLSPIGFLYGECVALSARGESRYQPTSKVVCVGNLNVGGTGKTPIAIAVAKSLLARGHKPVFLTRGYGGRKHGPVQVQSSDTALDVGDEPLLLAAVAPTIVSRNRVLGAKLADEMGADTIIMDDGFQNFELEKQLSLLVVDGAAGFGNGYIVPAGPLREPVSQGLKRADAVVIVGPGDVVLPNYHRTILLAEMTSEDTSAKTGHRVVAFAGIGRPEKFFASLRRSGAELVDAVSFGDHHEYTSAELGRLRAKARASNATLITTEKDFVRLSAVQREEIQCFPIRATFADPAALDGLLDRLFKPT